MARLIDVDEFIKEINNRCESAIKWGINAIADHNEEIKIRAEQAVATFCEASLTAKKMPTIDAVEVVRCKDCKHFDGSYPMCCRFEEEFKPDGYCSFGEKRDEDEISNIAKESADKISKALEKVRAKGLQKQNIKEDDEP